MVIALINVIGATLDAQHQEAIELFPRIQFPGVAAGVNLCLTAARTDRDCGVSFKLRFLCDGRIAGRTKIIRVGEQLGY